MFLFVNLKKRKLKESIIVNDKNVNKTSTFYAYTRLEYHTTLNQPVKMLYVEQCLACVYR